MCIRDRENIQRVKEYLSRKDWDSIDAYIAEFQAFLRAHRYEQRKVKELLINFFLLVQSEMIGQISADNALLYTNDKIYARIMGCSTLKELESFMNDYITHLKDYCRQMTRDRYSRPISETIEYINRYFNQDITLTTISEKINKMCIRDRSMNIPGFRMGKAPRKVIEQFYGPAIFYEEAFKEVYPDAYEKAIEDNDLQPVDYRCV